MGQDSDECTLCGLPVTADAVANSDGERFCCPGCRDVHTVLDDVPTVSATDFQGESPDREDERDDADPPPEQERTFLQVDGMHCTTCETFLETLAARQPGVSEAVASYVAETVRIDHDPEQVSVEDLRSTLSTGGYTARRRQDALGAQAAEDDLLWRVAAGVMLSMMVMLPYFIYIYPLHFSLYPPWMLELVRQQLANGSYFFYLLFVFTTLILLYTGGPLLRGAVVSLRARQPNMDLLVALAALSAYTYSTLAVVLGRIDVYYDVTVAIVVVVTAGTYYETTIKRRATDLLSELGTARVDEAHLLRSDPTADRPTDDPTADGPADSPTADGSTTLVSVDDLNPGDRILVREGERIPVDGTVHEGNCTVNEAVVTGESLPVEKGAGDAVVGGSILTTDAAVVEVGDEATNSLDRLTQLVWNLQSTDRGVQKLANRLAVVFVPSVLGLALVAVTAYLVAGAGITAAVLVGLTVLIVSCPCALGLATPLAVASSIQEAIEHGIVVFDDTIFERLRSVDTVVFDKTGTLTTGELTVRDVRAPPDLLDAAAVVERRSSHPVAEAIVAASDDRVAAHDGVTEPDGGRVERRPPVEPGDGTTPDEQRAADDQHGPERLAEFRTHAKGVAGVVDDRNVLVGHPDLFADHGWDLPDPIRDRVSAARAAGALPVVLGRDGCAAGVVVLEDEPRRGWAETVTALGDRGIDVVLLTGDDEAATGRFRDHPAIDRVFAGVPPEAKAETIRRLGADRQVAMVGDGTNDGPALASADLGIALGSGTALAVDAADIAIVDDDLASIETVFDLSVAAGRRIRQNIGWAFLYNAVAIPLALLGYLNPLFAAAAMASSSLLVVSNSSRDLLDSE